MGGLTGVMMLISLTGGRMGAQTAQLVIAQRKEAFKKWRAFIEFAAGVLLQAYFYWRGVPITQDKATGKEIYSLVEIKAQIKEGQGDYLQINFWTMMVEKGVKMLLELIEPSTVEEMLMSSLMANAGGGLTPNRVRSTGGNTY